MTQPAQPKVGDVVTVRAKITELLSSERFEADLYGSDRCHVFSSEDIVSIEPRPIAVGDRVVVGGIKTVKAIDGDDAWVTWRHDGSTGHMTMRLCDLIRAEP